MGMVVWSEAEQESLEQLAEDLLATDSAETQLQLVTEWYRWVTQDFTESVATEDLINIRQVVESYCTNQELINIVSYDINSPEKLNIFLADLESDQACFNQLMTYYFSETECTQGYDLETKFNAVAYFGDFKALGQFIMQAPTELQQSLYSYYLAEAIRLVMVDELKALLNHSPEIMAAALAMLGSELATQAIHLFSVQAVSVAKSYVPRMELGEIDAETAALMCAALADTKTYQFSPIIVEAAELDGFVRLLAEYRHELTNRSVCFIIAGPHWISGRIDFHTNGCDLCIIDSLGSESAAIMGSGLQMAELAQRRLAGVRIYVLGEERQHAMQGCSVYAIDDARHLHTIERYLPPAYAAGGLFAYLGAHSRSVVFNTKVTVQVARTPLPLLRTQQSSRLFNEIQQRGLEATIPVNKRGETASQSVKHNFFNVEGKPTNKRIEYKLEVFRNKTLQFLSRYENDVVVQKMLEFSMDVLQEKLKALRAAQGCVTTLGA